ncbi:protein of unknown function (DUF4201), putative [Trypanosoma equiperdum]|uniref:CCDC113/CCDC96 coiled-coil domain-containing protein n=2 Tax=Trypanozoon TaxID=39700 RepID=Q57X67_TRYB2|nr:hypothetical protein, conserved [Trypanosoma brucei brucei TREU927]AAX69802.1 hypothetical protein, conserved [Trypanosoma brucei]AAZ12515.1 hypothetical protein, conserved [Trypanosoma brucei brucei TREU927]SCU72000.1 Domain of unknown function (DUF4201), putative [Trypanosoma equiperdum]
MYEYDDQQVREEEQQMKAATVIQQRWKEFCAQREAEKRANFTTTVAVAAAASAAAAEGVEAEPRVTFKEEYRELVNRYNSVVERSVALQRLLTQHFTAQRQRKGEDLNQHQAMTVEAEQQYWISIWQMREEWQQQRSRCEAAEAAFTEMQSRHQGTIDSSQKHEEMFRQYIRELAERVQFVRTNKRLTKEEIDEFLNRDALQRRLIQRARIRYNLLRYEMEELQRAMAQRDQQQDGMSLIDFEQLKIENTNLNEKIEERNEDIVRLRRKVTTTIHVLTHVKEKLEFMKIENGQLRRQVASTEEELNGLRDKLAQTKRQRDHFTASNLRIREKMPMVGSKKLLLDYERRKAACNTMRDDVLGSAARHRTLLSDMDMKQGTLVDLQKALVLGMEPETHVTRKAKESLAS